MSPKLNAELFEIANKECIKANNFTEKFFNAQFDKAIKQAGYDIKEYHKHAKKYFNESDDDEFII